MHATFNRYRMHVAATWAVRFIVGASCVFVLVGYIVPAVSSFQTPDSHGGLGLLPFAVPSGLTVLATLAAVLELLNPRRLRDVSRYQRVVWRSLPWIMCALVACFFVPVTSRLVAANYGSWNPAENRGREWWVDGLMWAGFFAGVAAMAPLSVLGLPLSRTSALWRAVGVSFEESIALHRWCAFAMLSLLSFHGVAYFVAWAAVSFQTLHHEAVNGFDCGSCRKINNTAGIIAWLASLIMWLASVERARRWNYASFLLTHRLHYIFAIAACVHWPGCMTFLAPSLIFITADRALCMHGKLRTTVELRARLGGGAKTPAATTIYLQLPRRSSAGMSAQELGAAVCPGMRRAASTASAVEKSTAANGTMAEWIGSTINIAMPDLSLRQRCLRLCSHGRHPFTICDVVEIPVHGGVEEEPIGIVHVSTCNRWTRELADRAVSNAHPNASVRAELLGPFPAPPVLLGVVHRAMQNEPLLLIGAGSGLAPVVAVVRRIAAALEGQAMEMVSNVDVVLVCIVRDCELLDMLSGTMLPRAQTGITAYPWLRSELHVTKLTATSTSAHGDERSKPAEDGAGTQRAPLERIFVRQGAQGYVDVTSAPACSTALAPSNRVAGSRWPAREVLSILGATLGYLSCWYGVLNNASSQLHENHTSTLLSGGLGIVLASISALVGANLLLWSSSCCFYIVRKAESSRQSRSSSSPQFPEGPQKLHASLMCSELLPVEAATNELLLHSAERCTVALASNGARPDVRSILERWAEANEGSEDQEAQRRSMLRFVAVGAPLRLITPLDAALLRTKRRAAIRLTHSM